MDLGVAAGEESTEGWPGLESLLCGHCGKSGERLLRCSACRGAFFCSRECQQDGWKGHKAFCKERQGSQTPSLPGSPASSAPGSPREPGAARLELKRGVEAFARRQYHEVARRAEEAARLALGEGPASFELRCEALRLQGQAAEQLGDLARAKALLAQALSEARSPALPGPAATKAEANALLRLGAVARRSSQPGIAAQYQRKAVELLERAQCDQDTLAAAYNNLGISTLQQGDTAEAEEAFEKAFAKRKETGNVEGLIAVVTNLANLLRTKDQTWKAAERLQEARALAAACPRLEKQVLANLANLYENEFDSEPLGLDNSHSAVAGAGEAAAAGEAPGAGEGQRADAASEVPSAERALRCRRAFFGFPEVPPPPPPKPPPTCGFCQKPLLSEGSSDSGPKPMLRCGSCKRVAFCGEQCQRQAWPEHRKTCRPAPAPSQQEKDVSKRDCPICLEPLALLSGRADRKKVTILQCFHCLHTDCWEGCLTSEHARCPECRDNLGFSI